MYNPEKLTTLGTEDTRRRQKKKNTRHSLHFTLLYITVKMYGKFYNIYYNLQ